MHYEMIIVNMIEDFPVNIYCEEKDFVSGTHLNQICCEVVVAINNVCITVRAAPLVKHKKKR